MTHTHTQLGVTTSVASLIFCSGLCRFSRQFLSARPAHPDVLAHTPSNLSQEGGGSPASLPPPLHPRQGCLSLTFPLTHSLTHSLSLSVSLSLFSHCSDADGSDGLCVSVWLPPPILPRLHSRRQCVITEQRRG